MPSLRKEIKRGVIAHELMVAEAIDRGLASSDPIARNRLRELIMFSIYQEADMGVTPEAIRGYYEKSKVKYYFPEMRRLQHLFVRVTNVTDDEKAKATLDKLFKGAKGPRWERSDAVVKAITPVWIVRTEVRSRFGPTFADWVFKLPTGDWSDVYQSTSGWHRVRILEKSTAKQREFEEVGAEVEADLRKKLRRGIYERELDRLSNKFKVRIEP